MLLNELSLHCYNLFQIKIIFTICWSSNAFFWKDQEVSSEDSKKANNAQVLGKDQLHALKNSDRDQMVQKGKSGTTSSEGIQSAQIDDCRKYYVRCTYWQLII